MTQQINLSELRNSFKESLVQLKEQEERPLSTIDFAKWKNQLNQKLEARK